jgi:hypothetical protein
LDKQFFHVPTTPFGFLGIAIKYNPNWLLSVAEGSICVPEISGLVDFRPPFTLCEGLARTVDFDYRNQ